MYECSFFRAEGYQILRGLLPKQAILEVRDFLFQAMHRSLQDLAYLGLDHSDMQGSGRVAQELVATRTDIDISTRNILMGHFPLRDRLARELWAIPKYPALRSVLADVLDTDTLFMHMPPTARFVLPGNLSASVPPHQDISYNSHMPPFVVIWVPLVEIDAECGGMAIYEGTKNLPPQPVSTTADGWNSPIDVSRYRRIECQPMAPGDCILFGPNLAHASMANRSNRTRLSIDFRFFAKGRSGKHALDMQTWQVLEPALTNTSRI